MEPNKQKQVLLQSLTKKIFFNNIDVNYNLRNKKLVRLWLNSVIENENFRLGNISYNFCSDKHLVKINNKYLKHNTYTDIISFDLSDDNEIYSDIYISTERVKENAYKLKTNFSEEIHRVIIHGILHLCGYKDKTSKDIAKMRNKENHYISLLK